MSGRRQQTPSSAARTCGGILARDPCGRCSHRQMREPWQTDGHDRKRDGQRDILIRRRSSCQVEFRSTN
ncbi:hypothetical protein PUN28_014476 [Cardiocondyla obscurior]|uniref:Uncharacterized protein n=1 Tax=Cardiocondyla obscurior TaxID=286306 RepID=A0AAW2F1Y6_9HYME